jgi:hypothetical protein
MFPYPVQSLFCTACNTSRANGTVTAPSLHNLVDGLDIYQSLITDQTNVTSVSTADELLIAIAAGSSGDAPKAVTVQELFQDALSDGTYSNANISETLSYGTATGTRLVSANATITTGTITTGVIPTLTSSTATFGTTTSTAATITSGTITNLASTTGTIAALNSTTGTITTLNSTTGTIGALNSTTGTIATLNSTTGTITTLNSTTGTIDTATSATSTVSSILTSKNVAINVNTLSTATGTQNIDFTSEGYLTHSITGNITYTASNYAEGKSLTIRITSDGTARNLTFPTNWIFVGAKPVSIAASKVSVLSITSFGTTEANTVAAYAVQT